MEGRQTRLAQVRRQLRRHKLDALLVSGMANVRYLTGFTGSHGLALLTADRLALVVDFRYYAQAAQEAPDAQVIHVAGTRYGEAIAEAVGALSRVAFEADALSYADALAYQSYSPDTEWVPSRGLVEASRMVKDAREIARLREAGLAVSTAVTAAIAGLHAGTTERALAAEIDRRMRLAGAEANAFETLVASGERSALPHPYPTDKPIARGEWVLIDAGAVVGGYRSDMTRAFVLGEPDQRQRAVWNSVHAALQTGLAALEPGAIAGDVHAAVVARLARDGLAEAFGHDTGHGVGLEIHEGPRLAADSDDALEAGMVVTVEPGVYLPGWGGVRLEQTALVTPAGAEVLTPAPLSVAALSTPAL